MFVPLVLDGIAMPRVTAGVGGVYSGLYRTFGEAAVKAAARDRVTVDHIAEQFGVRYGRSPSEINAEAFKARLPMMFPAWKLGGGLTLRDAGLQSPLPKDRSTHARAYLVYPNDRIEPVDE